LRRSESRPIARITGALVVVLGVFAASTSLGPAVAAPGDLDPGFGTAGIVETAIGSAAIANGLALQPDGKILLAGMGYPGGIALARYTPDGALDPGFGVGGVVTGPEGAASGVGVQADGKIVVVGRLTATDSLFALVRYRVDGSLDAAFGSGGIATGPAGDARALAIQPNGMIVVAGFDNDPDRADLNAFTLARFDSDGTPDLGFGSNGVVRTRIGLAASAFAIALQPDGRIVVAGGSLPEATPPSTAMALARYLPNGRLDQTFGTDGVVSTSIGAGFSGGSDVALQPDGRIVVTGSTDNDFAVARFDSDGSIDETFGDFGSTTTQVGPAPSARAVGLGADGSIVVAGSVDERFALARYDSDGELDTKFGNGGVATSTIELRGGANALAIQPDGRILVGGWASGESTTRFVLARYLVTTPTTIDGDPLVVDYGKALTVQGTLTERQLGGAVNLVRRSCYTFSPTTGPTVIADADGGWTLRFRPQSRTVFWAKVGSDRSSPLTVRVRPRVTLSRLSPRLLRVRVVFVRSIAGTIVVLQSYSPSARHWLDEREATLRRSGRPSTVASSATFRLPAGPRRWFRVLLRQTDPSGCYTTSSSRAIRR
jgi:uncharacterized delta-60 repeat protein